MRGRNIISERGGAGRQWGGAGRTGVKIGRFEAVDRDCVVVARKSNAEVLIMTIKDREWAVVRTLERSLHSVTTNEDMTAVGQIFRDKHITTGLVTLLSRAKFSHSGTETTDVGTGIRKGLV